MVFDKTKQALSSVFEKFKDFALSLVKVPYSIAQDVAEIGDSVAKYIKDAFGDLRDAIRPVENYIRMTGYQAKDAVETYLAFSSEKRAILGVINDLSRAFDTPFVMTGYDKDTNIENGEKIYSFDAAFKPRDNIDKKDVISALTSIGFKVDQSGVLSMYDDERGIWLSVSVDDNGLLTFNATKKKRLF